MRQAGTDQVGTEGGAVPTPARIVEAGTDRLDILLVSEHNYPSQASGGRLLAQLCADLVAQGHRVSAICSAVHYTTDSGIVLGRRDTHAGVDIERYAPARFNRRSMVGRTVNELAYTARVGMRVLTRRRPDVLVVLSSPPFMLPALALIARLRRVPLVPVIMDLFPEMATVTGHLSSRSMTYRLWDWVQRAALGSSERTVVLGRCMQRRVLDKHLGVPVDVIPNWADDELHPVPRTENRFLEAHEHLRDAVLVTYSGNLGKFHDFDTMLAAAERLADRTDVRFLVIGDGAKRAQLEREIERRGIANVELLPFQPPELLLHSLNAADIALVTLETGAEGLCVPSKFYPLLAVGRPVIAVMGREAEVALVVEEAGCGAVVAPGDVDGLVSAVRGLADDATLRQMTGSRGRAVFVERFARRYAAPRYAATLHAAAAHRSSLPTDAEAERPRAIGATVIDRARASDLEDLVALHMRYLPPSESLASAFGRAYVRSAYRWLLTDPGALVLVARRGPLVQGYTSLTHGPYSTAMLRNGWREALLGLLRRPATLLHPDLRGRLVRSLRGERAPGSRVRTGLPDGAHTAHVAFTVVVPQARGTGVAMALKEASIRESRAAGLTGILTSVHHGNEASLRVNAKAGFRELDALPDDTVRLLYLPLSEPPSDPATGEPTARTAPQHEATGSSSSVARSDGAP